MAVPGPAVPQSSSQVIGNTFEYQSKDRHTRITSLEQNDSDEIQKMKQNADPVELRDLPMIVAKAPLFYKSWIGQSDGSTGIPIPVRQGIIRTASERNPEAVP